MRIFFSIAFSVLDHSACNRIIVQVSIATQDKLFWHLLVSFLKDNSIIQNYIFIRYDY